MRIRTLVGRMALAQFLTTALILVGVLVFSLVAIDRLVGRERDRALMNVASATVATLSELDDPIALGERRLHREMDEHRPAGVRIEAVDERGATVSTAGEGPHLRSVGDDHCEDVAGWRVCERAVGPLRILVGRSREDVEAARRRFVAVLAAACLAALALGALLSRAVARRGLRPLAALSTQISALQPGRGDRLQVASGIREIDDFSARFDRLLERVDEAVARERRFAAQASHELRTPLTVLRGELENLVQEAGTHRQTAQRALTSAEMLVRLVESLLLFGRAETRFDRSDLELLNLADLAREEIDRFTEERQDAVFSVDLPDELLVLGNEQLLGRAVSNLIDNALKYGSADPVEVSGTIRNGQAILQVRDHGPGVTEELQARIFEPFYRDPRTRAARSGFGLGLPLARAVARAHGGDVVVGTGRPTGALFELSVPLQAGP